MKKKTHEEWLEIYKDRQPYNYNRVIFIGKYNGYDNKIKVKCKIDGYEWESTAGNLLNGRGCCVCNSGKLTHNMFIKKVNDINPNIEVLGKYKNARTKILFKCKLDGFEWEAKPNSIRDKRGCPKCGGVAQITHEEFIRKMEEINPDIKIFGKYKNTTTRMKVLCEKCGNVYFGLPYNLLRGYKCKKCTSKSKGEEFINNFLKNKKINFVRECSFEDLSKHRFDFVLFDNDNLPYAIIEFDGKQHFESVDAWGGEKGLFNRQCKDREKDVYCIKNDIEMIRIPYYEFEPINNLNEILDMRLNLKKKHSVNLRYDVREAFDNEVDIHPQLMMNKLGVRYLYSTPHKIIGTWQFWGCEYMQNDLPIYLKIINPELDIIRGRGINLDSCKHYKQFVNVKLGLI